MFFSLTVDRFLEGVITDPPAPGVFLRPRNHRGPSLPLLVWRMPIERRGPALTRPGCTDSDGLAPFRCRNFPRSFHAVVDHFLIPLSVGNSDRSNVLELRPKADSTADTL